MKSEHEDLYEVEKLKEAYQKSVEYLNVQKQFANFEQDVKSKIADCSKKIKEENNVFELTERLEILKDKVEKMGKIDDAYEKYYQNKISLPELESILQTKKEYIDVSNALKQAANN